MKQANYIPPQHAETPWGIQHRKATANPQGFEAAIIGGIQAWVTYADAHKARFDSEIGDDYVLGVAWMKWGESLRVLLCGDLGRLDAGVLDGILVHNMNEQGAEL